MSSAIVREMSSTSGQSGQSGETVRAEIRKKQNRDSARRSREKRKTHLRGVVESVEQQGRRVRELDARVSYLEQLVNREGQRKRKTATPKTRATIVEEQCVVAATAAVVAAAVAVRETLDAPSPLQESHSPPHKPVHPSLQGNVHHPELQPLPLVQVHEHSDEHSLIDDPAAFDPSSPTSGLEYPLRIDPVQTGQHVEGIEPTQSVEPWQALPDAALPDAALDPLEGFLGDM